MDSRHRLLDFCRTAAIAAALVLGLNGCGPNQAAIDAAVAATRTADSLVEGPPSPAAPAATTGSGEQQALEAIETAVAATMAESKPRATGPEPDGDRSPSGAADTGTKVNVCLEPMATLQFVSNGYLASGWFLVTLAKPGGFEASEYTLLVNGQASECSMLPGRTDRVYCIGPYIPPTGLIPIQLLSADSSCSFATPFEAMSVIPMPVPTSAGTYY
jgi:hypothetical protein